MKDNRRSFIRNAGTFGLGMLALPRLKSISKLTPFIDVPPFGIQLFTVMKQMDTDAAGTLKAIADIGYREIESAFSSKGGYYGMKPKEFSNLVSDSGMHWRSHHVIGAPFKLPANAKVPTDANGKPISFAKMRNLSENFQELVDEAAEGGVSYLVCASIPVGTFDQIKKAVEVFSKTGEACKKAGIQFAYHNHVTEFDQIEGHRPFDYILSNTDKNLVKMEMDLGWASKAGQDPVALFKEHPGRFPLWHVKDFSTDFKNITEVGNGTINFRRIFDHAAESGMKYFFVEQDGAPDPIKDITISYNNLKKMLS